MSSPWARNCASVTTLDLFGEVHRLLSTAIRVAKRLIVMGEVDEERYGKEVGPLRRRLEQIDIAQQPLDIENAMRLLR